MEPLRQGTNLPHVQIALRIEDFGDDALPFWRLQYPRSYPLLPQVHVTLLLQFATPAVTSESPVGNALASVAQ